MSSFTVSVEFLVVNLLKDCNIRLKQCEYTREWIELLRRQPTPSKQGAKSLPEKSLINPHIPMDFYSVSVKGFQMWASRSSEEVFNLGIELKVGIMIFLVNILS